MRKRSVAFSTLVSLAHDHKLELAGFLGIGDACDRLGPAARGLERWREAGFAGDMGFMQRARELYTGFDHILPEARSILLFLVPYSAGVAAAESAPAGFGRVARYAWGRDYHTALKGTLRRFVDDVQRTAGTCRARVFSDAVPLLERPLAQRAGLGFIGKNTLLIRPGVGSFTFLAEVVWDLDIERDIELEAFEPEAGSGCGSCSRCLSMCPTGAFQGAGMLDARRCISYLTIEKRTAFSEEEARAIGEWVFGCDICQEVCPFNHSNTRGTVPQEFAPENGAGRWLDIVELLRISETEFHAQFKDTALMRAGRAGLVRNACAVAANRGLVEALGALEERADSDSSEIVRIEARRSVNRLLGEDFVEKSPVYVVT